MESIKNYLILALIVAVVILLLLIPDNPSKFEPERRRLNDLYVTQSERVLHLQKDTVRLMRRIETLEFLVENGQAQIKKLKEKKPKVIELVNPDSTFQKIYPTPDSLLFARGLKSNYIVSVQQQAYEDIIMKDYYKSLSESMDSTLRVFSSLVIIKDSLILNQGKVIKGKDDIIETLLKTQVNDNEEISVLRKKKKRNSVLMKIAIPAGIVGGFVLGSRIR